MCGRATQPEPSTPKPAGDRRDPNDAGAGRAHAAASAGRVRRAESVGGAGPAICGNGSTRASARSTVRGGAHVVQAVQDLRLLHLGAQLRLARDQEQGGPGDPDEREPERRAGDEPADRIEQPQRRDHREPTARDTSPRRSPPTAAARRRRGRRRAPASGVYGEPAPPCRRCGAMRAPISAPAIEPAERERGRDEPAAKARSAHRAPRSRPRSSRRASSQPVRGGVPRLIPALSATLRRARGRSSVG